MTRLAERPLLPDFDMTIALKSGYVLTTPRTLHSHKICGENLPYRSVQNGQDIIQPVRWLQAITDRPQGKGLDISAVALSALAVSRRTSGAYGSESAGMSGDFASRLPRGPTVGDKSACIGRARLGGRAGQLQINDRVLYD